MVADGNGKRVLSASFRHSAQMRTASLGAVAVDMNVAGYAFLRLAIPIRPSSPEPNSQTAAGTGTTVPVSAVPVNAALLKSTVKPPLKPDSARMMPPLLVP
jgi:hypothetical protein